MIDGLSDALAAGPLRTPKFRPGLKWRVVTDTSNNFLLQYSVNGGTWTTRFTFGILGDLSFGVSASTVSTMAGGSLILGGNAVIATSGYLVLTAITSGNARLHNVGTTIVVERGDGAAGGNLSVNGNSTLGTVGTIFTNVRHGLTTALVAGVQTVTDTGCTANTRYFFTVKTIGTVTIPSTYYVTTRNAGTSFVVTASVLTDTSTLDWMAVEP